MIKDIQKAIDAWIQQYGVRYFDPMTNLAQLMEEVGEVARIMARKFGEQAPKPSEKSGDLAEELSDVLFVLGCLANQNGIDLEKAFFDKLEKKTRRDKDRHLKNKKLQ